MKVFLVFSLYILVSNVSVQCYSTNIYKKQCSSKPSYRIGMNYFSYWLLRLKLCQIVAEKTYYTEECAIQRYKFTEYHSRIYESFCDVNSKVAESLVLLWLKRMNFSSIEGFAEFSKKHFSNRNDVMVKSFIDEFIRTYTVKKSEPQVDAAFTQTDFEEHEIFYRPFVRPKICALSRSDYDKTPFTASCFDDRDNHVMKALFAVDLILVVIVVTLNFFVLFVAIRTNEMKNVPGYFKVSLAVADFIVGAVVLPGSAFLSYKKDIAVLPYKYHYEKDLTCAYMSLTGFFTVLSVSASVMTMFTASVERFLTVSMPLKSQLVTKKRLPCVLASIWTFSAIIALIPIVKQYAEEFQCGYDLTVNSLIVGVGATMTVLYAIFLGIPLICMWALNAFMFHKVRRDFGRSSLRTIRSIRKGSTMRRNLFSTISLKIPSFRSFLKSRRVFNSAGVSCSTNIPSPKSSKAKVFTEDIKEKSGNVNQSNCSNM